MLPVAVCGAGPVGLVLALELAGWQVPVLLVERHRQLSPFPRGRAISTRSMEILRQLGLEQELTARGLARAETSSFFSGSSLTAAEFGRIGSGVGRHGTETGPAANSPTATLACPQDRLEQLLREQVVAHPLIDARFGTQLLDVRHRADHVEIRLRPDAGAAPGTECGSGAPETDVRVSWLIGADGSRSTIRRLAGIGTDPVGQPCSNVNILFDAELGPLIRDRSSLVYTISNPDVHATVLTVDNQRRWLVNVVLPDGKPPDPTSRWCERMVRAAIGRDEVEFRVLGRQCWQASAWLARRYRQGRLLLTGDAAHVCTPYGGFGMNLGLADAHNLAWKLALCATGRAGEELIGTYEPERRPIGQLTVMESARRLAAARRDHRSGRAGRGEITGRPSDGLVLGGVYRSAAVHTADRAPAQHVARYQPDAAPGCRAPHARLADGRSTLDLFGPWFTLLTGTRYRITSPLPDLVRLHRCLEGPVAASYGVRDRGAVLVRPDGHVAWRAEREDDQPPACPWLVGGPDRGPRVSR